MLALRIPTMTNAFCSTRTAKCCLDTAEHPSSKSLDVDECRRQAGKLMETQGWGWASESLLMGTKQAPGRG